MRRLVQRAPVPLAIAVTLGLQTAAALMWAGAAGERIAQLESREAHRDELLERTARLEAQSAAMRDQLARIESKLDALKER